MCESNDMPADGGDEDSELEDVVDVGDVDT